VALLFFTELCISASFCISFHAGSSLAVPTNLSSVNDLGSYQVAYYLKCKLDLMPWQRHSRYLQYCFSSETQKDTMPFQKEHEKYEQTYFISRGWSITYATWW
jgi:hypothetical protein